MALLGNFILRLIVICVGFAVAIMAVGIFMALGFYSKFPGAETYDGSSSEIMFALMSIGVGFISTLLIGGYSYGIAAMMITIAEAMRWKSMATNLAMGGFCAVLLTINSLDEAAVGDDNALLIALSSGFVSGFVYWAIAGRHAGDWRGGVNSKEREIMKKTREQA